jgi:hypothetical protein
VRPYYKVYETAEQIKRGQAPGIRGADPPGLEQRIVAIPGVVGTGLFLNMADAVLVQRGTEMEVLTRPSL